MSLVPVYVRARDAAFYRNPIVDFPEGFVCFDDVEPPELVLWIDELQQIDGQMIALPVVFAILSKRLGSVHGVKRVGPGRLAQRVQPGTEPPLFRPAVAFHLELARRIPQPRLHEGSERRTSRVGNCFVLDLPAHPGDPDELTVGQ